jgi:hypothetical protein
VRCVRLLRTQAQGIDKMKESFCYDDIPKIAQTLIEKKSIVFSFSENKVSCMIIFLSIDFYKMNEMPFGGRLDSEKIFVGILGRGFYHFNIRQKLHPGYVDEKLRLGFCDSTELSFLLNEIFKFLILREEIWKK